MLKFYQWLEAKVEYPGEFTVKVDAKHIDQPTLIIDSWGQIRLFYTGGYGGEPHWIVHHIRGEKPGAGTILYFAALLWALSHGDKLLIAHREKPAKGVLSCDSTLSPDAIRTRNRMQTQYADYTRVIPHQDPEEVRVHRGDNTTWRRKATPEEATMWQLVKQPPFEFTFV
jgi:hypothetical protein